MPPCDPDPTCASPAAVRPLWACSLCSGVCSRCWCGLSRGARAACARGVPASTDIDCAVCSSWEDVLADAAGRSDSLMSPSGGLFPGPSVLPAIWQPRGAALKPATAW